MSSSVGVGVGVMGFRHTIVCGGSVYVCVLVSLLEHGAPLQLVLKSMHFFSLNEADTNRACHRVYMHNHPQRNVDVDCHYHTGAVVHLRVFVQPAFKEHQF
eukprot:m.45714 g.45714  ORF g.45714 m.45714 type:complete len:101 (-) comp20043_c0_seq1:1905-2207(-)